MKFCQHLRENNQDYLPHLFDAVSYAFYSFWAGIVFIIHAFMPFLLPHTGSSIIDSLNTKIAEKQALVYRDIQSPIQPMPYPFGPPIIEDGQPILPLPVTPEGDEQYVTSDGQPIHVSQINEFISI